MEPSKTSKSTSLPSWTWGKRLIVFVTCYGFVWGFTDPALTLLGFPGSVKNWGMWAFIAIFILAVCLTSLSELIARNDYPVFYPAIGILIGLLIGLLIGSNLTAEADAIEITALEVLGDSPYFVEKLETGSYAYVDRKYIYVEIPSFLQDEIYFVTANNDKWSTAGSFIKFTVDRPIIVYVAHDDCYINKPSWLARFRDTGTDLIIDSGDARSIYAREFSEGAIVLGGNIASGEKEDCNMYTIILSEAN